MTNATPPRPQDSSDQRDVYTHGYGSRMNQERLSRNVMRDAAFFVSHLRSGMSLLDCGCGPGSITLGLAKVVSPGEAIGIDTEQSQIELAQSHAAEQGIANARFEVASIYEIPFPESSFDAVFAHALLEHLRNPIDALKETYRVLKPGGVLGVRSCDWGGRLIYPPEPLVEQFFDIFYKLMEHNRGNPFIGRRLRSLLLESGFAHAEASASFYSTGNKESIQMVSQAFIERASEPAVTEQVIAQGWADEETWKNMMAALKAWGDIPGAFGGRPWCEAVGWKE